MKHIRVFSAVLFVMLLASCNQGTDTTVNGEGMWTIPKPGTQYVFEAATRDSLNESFDTIRILATGQNFGGKTGVIEYLDNFVNVPQFYHVELSGDICFADSINSDSVILNGRAKQVLQWNTYPAGSRRGITLAPSVDSDEGGQRIVFSDIRYFIGSESTTVPGGTFSTLHTREVLIDDEFSDLNSADSSIDTLFIDYWFAPSTGFYVKFIVFAEDQDGESFQQSGEELKKYLPR